MHYKVLVIGGGPAGLTCAYSLIQQGFSVAILDRGEMLENRLMNKSPYNTANGIGGCGLLSDGKYSFPPSASSLWLKGDKKNLRDSYNVLRKLVSKASLQFPVFNEEWLQSDYYEFNTEKEYKSIYAQTEEQVKLIKQLVGNITNIFTNTEITMIEKKEHYYVVHDTKGFLYYSDHIVFAVGKYSSPSIKWKNLSLESHFKLEVGIRLETSATLFIPNQYNSIDYKIIKQVDSNTQVRTFCNCGEGVVVKSLSDGIYSFNGSTYWEQTNKSNIGILVRTIDPYSEYAREMLKFINKNGLVFYKTIRNYIETDDFMIGKYCDRQIMSVINRIVDVSCADVLEKTIMCGPEIEYIGKYFICDPKELRIPDEFVWLAGDATGLFRGLLSALLSGIYIANNIKNYEEEN